MRLGAGHARARRSDRRGYQLLNGAAGASLRTSLFTLPSQETGEQPQAMDAA